MAGPCYPSNLPKFPFTTEEVRAIWEHAKAEYIDKGTDFDTTISGVANDLGLPPKYVLQAFNEPKAARSITNEMYRKQALRREAIRNAKQVVRGIGTPGYAKFARRVWNIPRSILTAGHYAVFPVTHAGDLAFRPTAWADYFKGVTSSYRSISKGYHERLMMELVNSPNFIPARRGGLQNAPEIEPKGIITSMSGPSRRGFDALKVTRQRLFDREWDRLAPEDQNVEMSRAISDWANKATGAVSGQVPFSKLQFAPQLTAAKWGRAVLDPIRTGETFLNWKNAPAADRQVALIRAKKAGEFAAAYAAFLAVNQGLNTALGSKDKVNFTDPTKSDFLQFKVHGHVLGIGSGVMEVYRLLGHLAWIGQKTKQDRKGDSAMTDAAKTLGRYALNKVEPTTGDILEAVSGEDRLTGRPLPFSKEKGTAKYPKMTFTEYALTHGPIPLNGGIREAYDSMRQKGMSAPDATMAIKAAEATLIEGAGLRFYPTYEARTGKNLKSEIMRRDLLNR